MVEKEILLLIVEKKEVDVITGFICDSCGKEFEETSGGLRVKHTCGYPSKHDGYIISFQVCDDCLMDIVKDRITKAEIK